MAQNNAVQLKYNGVVFSDVVKTDQLTARTPCPLVSISTESNKDVDNNILYDRSTITLEGIILSSGQTNFLTQAYTGVVGFFSDKEKQNSIFEIVCGTRGAGGSFTAAPGGGFIQFSGTSFVSANADKSNDNWFLTIPYTVVLESISSKYSTELIESYEDSWTIEPLEDISYYNIYSNKISIYDIRNTTVNEPVDSSPSAGQRRRNTPPSAQLVQPRSTDTNHSIQSHLQYRITHRVSAVGKATKNSNPHNPRPGGNAATSNNNTTAYESAAAWVNRRVNGAIQVNVTAPPSSASSSKPTGVVLLAKNSVPFNPKSNQQGTMGLFLYNHIRSIESSPGAGSYGITDTWLALGTGVRYTEEFTWEVSVDDKWVHTVTMNGTIKGLETVSQAAQGATNLGLQQQGYTIMPSAKSSTATAGVTGYVKGKESANSNETYVIANFFDSQNRASSKYENALQAYTSGIKPYLYVRAGHALKTMDVPPVPDNIADQFSPYPMYKRTWFGPETRPLNIVPVTVNETFNPAAGTISYTVSYDNRPACLLSGALNASVTVNDTNSVDIVAEAFILGRPLGPVIEKVGSSKSERQLTIEALYPMPTGFQSLHPQSPQCVIYHTKSDSSMEYKAITNLVNAFKPVGAVAFATFGATPPYKLSDQGQVFKTADSETWSPFEGRYTRNVTWIYNTGTCT